MNKLPEKIAVKFNGGFTADLRVDEFHPYEPAAYVHDPGWSCHDLTGDEYFVSESGIVYRQPDNEEVGIAPEIKEASDKMEAQIDEALKHDD